MRPIFLTGERIYVRAMLPEDKDHTIAWFDSPLPLNSVFGEEHLKEIHSRLWDATTRQFAIVEKQSERVIGGAVVRFSTGDRKAGITLHMVPLLDEADTLQGEALGILVPWLLDDHNMRRVDATLSSSHHETVAAAERLGMFEGVRLRQFWRTPAGRVDALIYQILNPNEEHLYA